MRCCLATRFERPTNRWGCQTSIKIYTFHAPISRLISIRDGYLLSTLILYVKSEFEHAIFVHVIDQCPQDSRLFGAILADVLRRLKAYDSSIEQACLRSDNAGCYRCVSTLLSMPTISETSGMTTRRMDFTDPQGEKGKRFSNIAISA